MQTLTNRAFIVRRPYVCRHAGPCHCLAIAFAPSGRGSDHCDHNRGHGHSGIRVVLQAHGDGADQLHSLQCRKHTFNVQVHPGQVFMLTHDRLGCGRIDVHDLCCTATGLQVRL